MSGAVTIRRFALDDLAAAARFGEAAREFVPSLSVH